jgi:hypothetical protein
MKIRDRLLLSFGLYILLAIVVGLVGYRELNTISKRLVLVEIADDMTNTILEVRRYEKNYLLFKDEGNLKELKQFLGKLKKNVDNMEIEIIKEIGEKNFTMMSGTMHEYENIIDKIMENYRLQGEILSMVAVTGSKLEKRLSGNNLRLFLDLRKQEKNLMMKKDHTEYNNFREISGSLKIDGEIEHYQILIDKLYALYTNEQELIDDMRATAREIQNFTESLSKSERARSALPMK